MDTSAIIAVVAVIVVLVVAVLVALPMLRRRRLQEKFGPEYDRVVGSHENRAVAERELVEREKRYKQLELHPLSPEVRDRYATEWTRLQAQFVDAPESTVTDADRLVTELMAERGYPTEDYDQQLADLSVEHASTLEHYRDAHDVRERIGNGDVSTEDLRNAMVHYRALFVDLLGVDANGDPAEYRNATVASEHRMDAGEHRMDAGEHRMDAGEHRVDADERRADANGRMGAETAGAEVTDSERGRSDRHRAPHRR